MGKRMLLIALCLVLLFGAFPAAAQGTSYCNSFDPDTFAGWSAIGSGGGSPQNTMSFRLAQGQGFRGGNAMTIGFNRTNTSISWGGLVEASLPLDWNDFSGVQWLHFMARGTNDPAETVNMRIYFYNADGTQLFTSSFTVKSKEWQQIAIPVSGLDGAVKLRFYDSMPGYAGEILVDDFTLTDTQPQGAELTYTNSFDPSSFRSQATWSGFKNNDGTYTDFITAEIAANEGKSQNAFRVSYQAATWYSGEVYIGKPDNWDARFVDFLEFDVKGKGALKMNANTVAVVNGTRYEYRLTVNSTDWQHIVIPLSSFQKNGVSLPKGDLVGLSFTAAENGGLSNSADATKTMTQETLLAKAKTGAILFDNMSITNQPHTGLRIGTVSLLQNGAELPSLSAAEAGEVTCRTLLQNYGDVAADAVMVAALYEESSGRLVGLYTKAEPVPAEGTAERSLTFEKVEGTYAKIFFWENTENGKPQDDRYLPVLF